MLAEAISEARPRVIAALAGQCRDFALAEDGFADAVEALLRLPPDRRPANVAGWLFVAGKRRILDMLRRRQRGTAAALAQASLLEEMAMSAEILAFPDPIPDDRLRLVFAACHPAIAPDMRVALSLKLLFGIDMTRLAAALMTSAPTLYQRLGRTTAKIRDAGIAYEVPERRHWPERLAAVLATLELAYAVAYQDGAAAADADLAPEVQRLATLMTELLPDEPEVLALAALIALAESRRAARIDADGVMVPLSRQDVACWDRAAVARGTALLDRAAACARPGPLQLLAAIHLAHARRIHGHAVDWAAIVTLYDALAAARPTPAIAVARALALAERDGPDRGLTALGELEADRLRTYRPYACAQAHLRGLTGDHAASAKWWAQALSLGPLPAEARWIERQLSGARAAAIS